MEIYFEKIEEKLGQNIINQNEFVKWRNIRNRIVHDLYIPNEEEIDEFTPFLTNLIENLGLIVNNAGIKGNFHL